MNTLATIHFDRQEDVIIASIEGDVDLSNAGELGEKMLSAMAPSPRAVVIDLSRVTYLDSRGTQFLLDLLELGRIRHLPMRVVVPEESPLRRLLTILSVMTTFNVHPTLDEAIARIQAPGESG